MQQQTQAPKYQLSCYAWQYYHSYSEPHTFNAFKYLINKGLNLNMQGFFISHLTKRIKKTDLIRNSIWSSLYKWVCQQLKQCSISHDKHYTLLSGCTKSILQKPFCIFKNDIEETLEEKFTKSSVRLEVFADNLQF